MDTILSNERVVSASEHWTDKAEAWLRHADVMARTADAFNSILLDAADLQPGQFVLDLASGAGEPAFSEAKRVGPEGLVVATDLVEPMIQGLKRRDRDSTLQLSVCDMQALPFAEAAFDRIVCRFGIMFPPNPLLALKEAARVLKTGGRASYMVWGPLADQTLFKIVFDAIETVLGTPPNTQHQSIFRFGEGDSLSTLCADAGFKNVESTSHLFKPLAPADKPFWHAQLGMTFGTQMADLDASTKGVIDDVIKERLAATLEEGPDGVGYRLNAHIRVVSADT